MAEPQKQQKTKTVTGKKNAFVANDFAKNLGTCAAIRATFNLGNFVGKGNSAKELAANTKIPNMEDVYEIACVGLPEESWKGKSVDAIFNYLAAKKTLHVFKEAGKKVVTQKGEEITDEAVLKNPAVMKDSSGKAYYQKFKREMFAEFESGIDATRTELMLGKPVTDPYTKEKVDASKASKILNGVGKAVSAAGSQIGYILGLDKTNKDIYSKMLFSVIGGGSKLWAAAKKAAATAKTKNQKQGKETPTEAKPAETAPEEQKKEASAETQSEEPKKEQEGQANNPEGEEPQKPKISQELKDQAANLKGNFDKMINALVNGEKPPTDMGTLDSEKTNIIKALNSAGIKISGKFLPSLYKIYHTLKESINRTNYAKAFYGFILAENMIDVLEADQPSEQVNDKENPKREEQQKGDAIVNELKSLLQRASAMLEINDEKEFESKYDAWNGEIEEIALKILKDKDSVDKLVGSGSQITVLTKLINIAKENAKQQKLNASFDAEITDVANKFLNMLREKYK